MSEGKKKGTYIWHHDQLIKKTTSPLTIMSNLITLQGSVCVYYQLNPKEEKEDKTVKGGDK